MVITVSISEKAQAMVKFGGAFNILGLIRVSTHKSTGSTLAIKYGLDPPLINTSEITSGIEEERA